MTADLLVLAGSEFDPLEKSGLAALTAAMLTKGTARLNASAFARAVESLGGALDGGASWGQSYLSMTVNTAALDRALALISEAVQSAAFKQPELERLRRLSLDDLKVAYAQASTIASVALQETAFSGSVYGHSTLGTPRTLRAIRLADVVGLHAALYRPDNAVLILCGDISAPAGQWLARRHFQSWTARAPGPRATSEFAVPRDSNHPLAFVDLAGSDQASVALMVPMPALAGERETAMVMNAVLGGGYSSRLNQAIRVQRGLSYSVHSEVQSHEHSAALEVVVQTKNESAAQVVDLVHVELDRLIATLIEPEELNARKLMLIGELGRSIETTAGLAAVVHSMIVAHRPLADLGRDADSIARVSAQDIQSFARSHLEKRNRRAVVVGDSSIFFESLRQIEPNLAALPIGTLDLDPVPDPRVP